MADKDPIAERNADIVARLKASDDYIRSGLTEKPADQVRAKPAPSRTVASPSSRSRKR